MCRCIPGWAPSPRTAMGSGSGGTATGRGPASHRPDRTQTSVQLAAHIESPLFMAHVPAAIGSPVQETNCHPFRDDRWLFVHNGFIADFHTLRRDLISPLTRRGSPTSSARRTPSHLQLASVGREGGDEGPSVAAARPQVKGGVGYSEVAGRLTQRENCSADPRVIAGYLDLPISLLLRRALFAFIATLVLPTDSPNIPNPFSSTPPAPPDPSAPPSALLIPTPLFQLPSTTPGPNPASPATRPPPPPLPSPPSLVLLESRGSGVRRAAADPTSSTRRAGSGFEAEAGWRAWCSRTTPGRTNRGGRTGTEEPGFIGSLGPVAGTFPASESISRSA